MGTAIAARTASRLRAFDQQQRRDSQFDANPQQELLGFSLGTPSFEVAPKVIVKKNAGAVHSHSKLSCLERKLFNVCLYIAHEDLADPSKLTHRAPIGEISTLAGFDTSKNTAHLKKAFRTLVSAIVEWSIVDERGAETWEACSVLAGVRFRNGMCEFEFPWILREKLYQPERYARLDLAEMRNLSSVGAVALSETLVRYENMRRTPVFKVELWRALLGADATTYDDFRRFNEKVIQPAVAQINTHIPRLTTEPEFFRQDRRVVAMRFNIKSNAIEQPTGEEVPGDEAMGQAAPLTPLTQRLFDEMLLTRSQIDEVLRDYEEARIAAVLDYVAKRHMEGKVNSSIPAYFLSTISRFEETPRESTLVQRSRENEKAKRALEEGAKRLQGYREAFSGVWRARAQQVLDDLPADQRVGVLAAFEAYLVANENPALKQWQGPERETSPALGALLRNFVAERFLPDRETAYSEWVQGQESALVAP